MNFVEKLHIKVHCRALQEAQILPPNYFNGLNRLREELPQFSSIEDVDSFAAFCKETGTRVSKKSFKVRDLNPTQSHIDSDKVISIVQNYTQTAPGAIQPIVIDKDGYVIDGHHRWAALMYINPNMEIPCYQFNVKVKYFLGNKVPRWQDTIGNDKKFVESLTDDIVEPEEIFSAMSTAVVGNFAKASKLFVKKSDKLLSVVDRAGNKYVFLRQVSKGASLEVWFPTSDTPEVKVFNHWQPEYAWKILKALNELTSELKEYWEDFQFAATNRNEINKLRNEFRSKMSNF